MAIVGVLFDIDGVLVTSWRPIAGASKTLRTLSDHQIACSYLTNTTTRTRVQIAELLTEAGMAVRADEVITAAGVKHYQEIDVPAELAWTIVAETSPWVADTRWARSD